MPARLPLTFQQEWLWSVIRADESWQCAATRAFRLSGSLNIPLLRKCIRAVTARHDALRTQLVVSDASVWQEARDPEGELLSIVTIEGADATEVATNARRHVDEACDRKIGISAGPLWNARLLRLSEHAHWLVLSMHRLMGDCASIEQTYRETKSLYTQELQGGAPDLKHPAQYGDFTRWQQEMLADWGKRHEPYWQRHLQGAFPVQWPGDPVPTFAPPGRLGKAQCSFGMTLSAGLMNLARTVRTLPAVPMMAIYVAVLWHWCGQEDFVLPLNTAGQPTGYKSAMGFFSCPLYLRMHIAGNETFKDLVSRVGNEFFGSLAHQDFGRIARQRPELLAGTVFQWMTWHPEETPDELGIRAFGEGMTIVPAGMTALEVTVFDTVTGLHAFGSYRADRFAAKTMERFMTDLRQAAELFLHNPDARIASMSKAGGDAHGTAERGVHEAAAGA